MNNKLKKITVIAASALIGLTLAACSFTSDNEESEENAENETSNSDSSSKSAQSESEIDDDQLVATDMLENKDNPDMPVSNGGGVSDTSSGVVSSDGSVIDLPHSGVYDDYPEAVSGSSPGYAGDPEIVIHPAPPLVEQPKPAVEARPAVEPRTMELHRY